MKAERKRKHPMQHVSEGARHQHLSVVRRATRAESNTPHRQGSYWHVECDCGKRLVVAEYILKRGDSTSCGSCSRKSHGRSRTPEFYAWVQMRKRCRGTSCERDRAHYLERGIRVCERWETFENFLVDMGPKPTPRHSIDRIDNDGNYEPGNVRWATPEQQMANRRCTVIVMLNGAPWPLRDAATELGITYYAAYQRMTAGTLKRVPLAAARRILEGC